MRFERFSFGSIRIDGVTHKYDVVIDRGTIRKRKKKPSKTFRDAFGHTPLSVGKDSLEMPAARDRNRHGRIAGHERSEARSHAPQNKIARASQQNPNTTNAILHVTC